MRNWCWAPVCSGGCIISNINLYISLYSKCTYGAQICVIYTRSVVCVDVSVRSNALSELIEKGKEDEVMASAVLVLGSCVQRWVIILSEDFFA